MGFSPYIAKVRTRVRPVTPTHIRASTAVASASSHTARHVHLRDRRLAVIGNRPYLLFPWRAGSSNPPSRHRTTGFGPLHLALAGQLRRFGLQARLFGRRRECGVSPGDVPDICVLRTRWPLVGGKACSVSLARKDGKGFRGGRVAG